MEPFDALRVRERLLGAGILPTVQRIAVAAVLMQRPGQKSPEQVLKAVRELLPGISLLTVARVLRLFARKRFLDATATPRAATAG